MTELYSVAAGLSVRRRMLCTRGRFCTLPCRDGRQQTTTALQTLHHIVQLHNLLLYN